MKKSFTLLQASIVILMLTFISLKASAQVVTPAGPTTPGNYSTAAQIVCPGGPISLQAPSDANSTYIWRKMNTSGAMVVVKGPGAKGDNLYTETPTAVAGYYTYTVEQINANSCSNLSDPFSVYVLPPILPVIAGGAPFCEAGQGSASLSITGLDANYTYNYQWTRNGVNVGANLPTYTVNEAVNGTYTYAVKVTFVLSAGLTAPCTYTASKAIVVYPLPTKPVISIN
jgi:hypothetical protein